MREARLAAKAGGGAGENDRAAAERSKPAGRLTTYQKAAEAADPPELLKLRCGQRAEVDPLVVARVEDDAVDRVPAFVLQSRPIEEANDIVLSRRVYRHEFDRAAIAADSAGVLLDLLRRPSGDGHVITLRGEAATKRGTEPTLGTHADDQDSPAPCTGDVVAIRLFEIMFVHCCWPPSLCDRFDGKRDTLATAYA